MKAVLYHFQPLTLANESLHFLLRNELRSQSASLGTLVQALLQKYTVQSLAAPDHLFKC